MPQEPTQHQPPLDEQLHDVQEQHNEPATTSRRRFILGLGAAAAFAGTAGLGSVVRESEAAALPLPQQFNGGPRVARSFTVRLGAAVAEASIPIPPHPSNGDENRYSNRMGNYSKGLPHDDELGLVDPHAYQALLNAVNSGAPSAFSAIPLGGTVRLVDPQSGLAFDLEGTDSHQLAIPPAPALASAWRAAEAVEDYWQALLRDVNFSDYATSQLAADAIAELNKLTDFRGPRDPNTGKVTAQSLFRGFTPEDLLGPYISQFMYPTLSYGAAQVVQQFQTDLPGFDFMTSFDDWLAVQNGQAPFPARNLDPTRRYPQWPRHRRLRPRRCSVRGVLQRMPLPHR
jgi:hypothetical protein